MDSVGAYKMSYELNSLFIDRKKTQKIGGMAVMAYPHNVAFKVDRETQDYLVDMCIKHDVVMSELLRTIIREKKAAK